jgi:hypothetical protein
LEQGKFVIHPNIITWLLLMRLLVTITLDKWLYMTEPGLSTNSHILNNNL